MRQLRHLSPAAWGKILGLLLALLIALAIVGASVAWGSPSPPHRLAPAVPCTSANRMDVFIDEDNIMYECECQMLVMGTLCAWQVIGGVDSPEVRRFLRRRHLYLVKQHGRVVALVGTSIRIVRHA